MGVKEGGGIPAREGESGRWGNQNASVICAAEVDFNHV